MLKVSCIPELTEMSVSQRSEELMGGNFPICHPGGQQTHSSNAEAESSRHTGDQNWKALLSQNHPGSRHCFLASLLWKSSLTEPVFFEVRVVGFENAFSPFKRQCALVEMGPGFQRATSVTALGFAHMVYLSPRGLVLLTWLTVPRHGASTKQPRCLWDLQVPLPCTDTTAQGVTNWVCSSAFQ